MGRFVYRSLNNAQDSTKDILASRQSDYVFKGDVHSHITRGSSMATPYVSSTHSFDIAYQYSLPKFHIGISGKKQGVGFDADTGFSDFLRHDVIMIDLELALQDNYPIIDSNNDLSDYRLGDTALNFIKSQKEVLWLKQIPKKYFKVVPWLLADMVSMVLKHHPNGETIADNLLIHFWEHGMDFYTLSLWETFTFEEQFFFRAYYQGKLSTYSLLDIMFPSISKSEVLNPLYMKWNLAYWQKGILEKCLAATGNSIMTALPIYPNFLLHIDYGVTVKRHNDIQYLSDGISATFTKCTTLSTKYILTKVRNLKLKEMSLPKQLFHDNPKQQLNIYYPTKALDLDLYAVYVKSADGTLERLFWTLGDVRYAYTPAKAKLCSILFVHEVYGETLDRYAKFPFEKLFDYLGAPIDTRATLDNPEYDDTCVWFVYRDNFGNDLIAGY